METTTLEPPENAVDVSEKQDGGVMKVVLREGEGYLTPSLGDTVFVHYVGTLTDGEKFDSSRDRGEQFEFQLGKGKVIKAWDRGVETMKKGELAKFWCKSEYAYGETGSPPKIPPNATLIFEVELYEWKGEDITEDKDGGIMKHEIKMGDGYKTPNEGATVNLHYIGRLMGNTFEDREVEFEVGEATEKGLVSAFDRIAQNLKMGEKARFDVAPQYGYGQDGNKEFKIPPVSYLDYEVEMKNFEKVKDSWEMDSKEKLEQSEIAKSKGTSLFKAANYKKAVQNYNKVLTFLEHETSLEAEDQKHRDALVLAAHLNLAMSYLKMDDCFQAVEQCNKALELDTKNVKAIFRRGQARVQTSEYEEAKVDFEEVLALEPDNKAAKNQVTICNQRIKQFNDKQKKLYAGMFTKFAEQDAKKAPKVVEAKPDESMKTEESKPEGGGDSIQNGETKSEKAEETAMES